MLVPDRVLVDQPRASSATRRANYELAAAGFAAHHQQIGNIGAGNHDDQTTAAKRKPSGRALFLDKAIAPMAVVVDAA
jgi:hypothetical protein